jgi:hypothetical protein
MLNKSKMIRFLSLSFAIAGFMLVSGHFTQTNAQIDPFKQPEWKRPKKTVTTVTTPGAVKPEKKGPPPIMVVEAPAIEQRINYYKQMRETAAANGSVLPKVTSVLTLNEMSVTGIFKTSRGYAAMVEATPIKLSYTIYPGEKFFDGQLVAIEENRLVFRKVVKMSNNKFIASVENKTLRQYTAREEIQGTAPVENNSANKTEVVANNNTTDEMNKQPESKPEDSVKDKNGKKNKKPVKVAKKS